MRELSSTLVNFPTMVRGHSVEAIGGSRNRFT